MYYNLSALTPRLHGALSDRHHTENPFFSPKKVGSRTRMKME